MGTYNPGVEVQREFSDGFPRIRVNDSNVTELLLQVIFQLRIISLKLDCLQPNEETIDIIDDAGLEALDQ